MTTSMLSSSRSLSGDDAVQFDFPADGKRSYGYARSHRILEIFGLFFAGALMILTAALAVRGLHLSAAWLAALCCFGGLCLADFFSGLVHWSADTYGSPTMPIFGGFVRTFREHHADQADITRHDFIETNGDVCIFSSPVHFVLLTVVEGPLALCCIFGVFAGSYFNSQIHKWAHSIERPWVIRVSQGVRFFLSPRHHSNHHSGPHLTHYCITTGWMNPVLDRIGFFRKLEWLLFQVGLQRTT
jgi:plasmanylethanolamine desaturase